MKKSFWILSALAVMCVFAECSVAKDSIIGEWIPASNSRNGFGATRTYDTNGVVSVSFGVVISMKYALKGDKLILSPEDDPTSPQTFKIEGNTLTLKDPKTQELQKLTRGSASKDNSIVGQWIGDHATGAKQIMQFTTNMNCNITIPMRSMTGSFSLNNNVLIEDYPNEGQLKWIWEVSTNVLVLTRSGGSNSEPKGKKSKKGGKQANQREKQNNPSENKIETYKRAH
jgi:hypothetical protein